MPFVPLSTDGTQRATTEVLRAPRVQVALEPHEAGVTVLAVEPTGLRAIGQLDLTVADGYRAVLAPLAADGLYGICIAESTDSGTVLCLAPAECCLPAGDWPWRPDSGSDEGPAELAAWLAAPTLATSPVRGTGTVVIGPPAPAATRRPAHRRRPRAGAGRRAAAPWILAGVIGLLMAGAIAQALTGGRIATPAPLAAAEAGPVPVPGFAASPPTTEPPVVVAAPAAVTEPAADEQPPSRPVAPARKPVPPAPAPAAGHHDDADHHDDEHSAHSDGGKSDSSDAKKDDGKKDDAKPSGSGSGGSGKDSGDGGKGGAPDWPKRPTNLADLLHQLAEQRSGGGRPSLPFPHFGR